jgi:hypothetical protein
MNNAPHEILDETGKEIREIYFDQANQFTMPFTLISILSLQRLRGNG